MPIFPCSYHYGHYSIIVYIGIAIRAAFFIFICCKFSRSEVFRQRQSGCSIFFSRFYVPPKNGSGASCFLSPYLGVILLAAVGIYSNYVSYLGITPMTGVPESSRLKFFLSLIGVGILFGILYILVLLPIILMMGGPR